MTAPVATPLATARSASRRRRPPLVTVVVSSHNRAELLNGLLDALEAQDCADFEVIVADNGSTDETWQVLTDRCKQTPMPLRALRLEFHDGPGVPRNTAIQEARAELIAFTDDDCLPTPSWLSEIARAFDAETVIVQGQTLPDPGGWGGPWGRTLNVTEPSGLYETANLAARRQSILAAGGFPAERLLSGRAFGEDVVLGAAIARTGRFAFAADALVHHRVMPGTYRDFLAERRRLAGFPLLLRLVPELRRRTYLRIFLSRRTAITDLGLVGFGALFGQVRSPYFAVGLIGLLIWFRAAFRESESRLGVGRTGVFRILFADLVGVGALILGSIRARRLLV